MKHLLLQSGLQFQVQATNLSWLILMSGESICWYNWYNPSLVGFMSPIEFLVISHNVQRQLSQSAKQVSIKNVDTEVVADSRSQEPSCQVVTRGTRVYKWLRMHLHTIMWTLQDWILHVYIPEFVLSKVLSRCESSCIIASYKAKCLLKIWHTTIQKAMNAYTLLPVNQCRDIWDVQRRRGTSEQLVSTYCKLAWCLHLKSP